MPIREIRGKIKLKVFSLHACTDFQNTLLATMPIETFEKLISQCVEMKISPLSLMERPKSKPRRHENTEKTNLKLRDPVSPWFKPLG